MEDLKLDITNDTPEVIFDPNNQHFSISGKSLPENAASFYEPIYKWVIDYLSKNSNKGIILNLNLEYLNSSSIKLVFLILCKINEFYSETSEKSETYINWYYKKGDDLTRIKGEEFKELLDIPFNIISID